MSIPHITPARLDFAADGTPWSADYADVYHSAHGALDQAQHVFLAGNDLPQAWQGREQFVIVETGFGLGHNFLATWQAWRADPHACQRLHFISVEQHPFTAADLARAHQASGAPAALSAALCAQWPMLVPGFQRLEFDGGRLVLTLLLGEAAQLLPQCRASVDAIYLDGFAPGKNPQMWSAEVFRALAGLSRTGSSLATWSVAGVVRQGLREAGFAVSKAEGFAGKRQMLRGHFAGKAVPAANALPHEALVIGAGLAGSGICARLAQRGWRLQLLESGAQPAQGASGNLAGAFRPQPSADDNYMARLTRAGFQYQLRDLARLASEGHKVRWSQCGVLHVARDEAQARKLARIVDSLAAPQEFIAWLDADAAAERAGQPCQAGAWWFAAGGWINPPSLCAAHLASCGEALQQRFNAHVARLSHADGQWHAYDADDQLLGRAAHVVLANAHDARRLFGREELGLYSARGQVSHVPTPALGEVNTVVCGSGYLTPAVDGVHALGATFMVHDQELDVRAAEHAENLDKLGKMLPQAGHGIDTSTLPGRASLRPITSDRMPMLGALPGPPGLWLLSGFGARGLVWGLLCAEQLASQMHGEPLPLERDLIRAIDPLRYLG
ncbi:bifunctional tRNA (5-methylaminomethyl-2-thiouridine)(34)-methyltransferase MnmD/FAD-dependent 5-carboxymethylaminomethyl-2-thiouridine(34) oxidoreductase MnmC [Uliginosibacterium sediminicola]|uniref:tRNA 5-methylaminomethyl-2-thiouridine biosynthesis bifunctional protein MnmC n=1 Tax=Uliginosibacterium sediminicola TaxID=2024550 RepID=A0ABU9Z0D4_9RHOO